MKTYRDGVTRAFKPYEQYEVDLILSIVPTRNNVRRLAGSLGRTQEAISLIYKYAYSGNWLKRDLNSLTADQDNILTKIAAAKRRHKIIVGYQP